MSSISGAGSREPVQRQEPTDFVKPSKEAVKSELREIGKFIDSSIKGHNVKPESIKKAKELVSFIKSTLKENDEGFLTSNSTLSLIQQIKNISGSILIKDKRLEKKEEIVKPTKEMVKKEFEELKNLIQSELTKGNVKPEKMEEAEQLLSFIKSTLKSSDKEEFLDKNTLSLVQLLKDRVPLILIKSRE
jgi:hypothetical protein